MYNSEYAYLFTFFLMTSDGFLFRIYDWFSVKDTWFTEAQSILKLLVIYLFFSCLMVLGNYVVGKNRIQAIQGHLVKVAELIE